MRFETSQQMRLGQQMRLAPRMIQSMEILQMSLAELEERIQQELESNPTLELVDGAPDEPAPAATPEENPDRPLTVDGGSGGDDFARLGQFEDSNPEAAENQYANDLSGSDLSGSDLAGDARDEPGAHSPSRWEGERDGKLDAMSQAPARGISPLEHLRGQWALCDVPDGLRPLGELILSTLEDDGYLRTPLETIAERAVAAGGTPPSLADLERALAAVQLLLEPAGVAARTPAECLVLQLDALEDTGESGWPASAFSNARRLVEKHLDDITHNRLPKVAEQSRLSLEQVREALTLLRRLSLAPLRRLSPDDARPITPDAIVEYDEVQDRYLAYLNDTRLPNLRINQEYARLAKDRAAPPKDRDFLRTNLSNAQWLLDAVGQRRHTLLRVVRAVVEAQRDFFDQGPQALRPLPMTLVAEQLGIHVATVSRAVADKHLATPRGIIPLRKFFSGGLTTDEGEAKAWDAIKAALREVIDAEDKSRPLSDDAIADELKKRGMDIARRTVAKYRDQLEIPSARMRRTF